MSDDATSSVFTSSSFGIQIEGESDMKKKLSQPNHRVEKKGMAMETGFKRVEERQEMTRTSIADRTRGVKERQELLVLDKNSLVQETCHVLLSPWFPFDSRETNSMSFIGVFFCKQMPLKVLLFMFIKTKVFIIFKLQLLFKETLVNEYILLYMICMWLDMTIFILHQNANDDSSSAGKRRE